MGESKLTEGQRKCLQSAGRILELADQTEKTLREKLQSKGYSPEDIDFSLDYLKEKRLFDEKAFFLRYLRALAERKRLGPLRYREELRKKGFREELISDRELFDEALSELDLFAIALSVAKEELRRHPLPELPDPDASFEARREGYAARRKAEQRLFAALARKGFSASAARDAVEAAREEG